MSIEIKWLPRKNWSIDDFKEGDRVYISGWASGRFPLWRAGQRGSVVRFTRQGSVVVRLDYDGSEWSCPPDLVRPQGNQ